MNNGIIDDQPSPSLREIGKKDNIVSYALVAMPEIHIQGRPSEDKPSWRLWSVYWHGTKFGEFRTRRGAAQFAYENRVTIVNSANDVSEDEQEDNSEVTIKCPSCKCMIVMVYGRL